jgi:hypothetical protein
MNYRFDEINALLADGVSAADAEGALSQLASSPRN